MYKFEAVENQLFITLDGQKIHEKGFADYMLKDVSDVVDRLNTLLVRIAALDECCHEQRLKITSLLSTKHPPRKNPFDRAPSAGTHHIKL